jgi:hypothetical protein
VHCEKLVNPPGNVVEPFISIYRKWFWYQFGEAELRMYLGAVASPHNYSFDTFYLPESYDIFRQKRTAPSGTRDRTIQRNRWSADGSAFSSTEEDRESRYDRSDLTVIGSEGPRNNDHLATEPVPALID